MPSLQDKICNGLTFVGLLTVIAVGMASLWPKVAAQPSELTAPEESATDAMPLDTLEELPMIEERPIVEEQANDTFANDTLSAIEPTSPDSATHHSTEHHATEPNDPSSSSATTPAKKVEEKGDENPTPPSKAQDVESLME